MDMTNTRQLGFLAALPPDIIPEIFSSMNQRDCMTCLAVCRDWYQAVPQYTQDIWRTLKLDARDTDTNNGCLIRCLGTHVKNVILDSLVSEDDVYHTMQRLLDWGCINIHSFGKFHQCQ